MKTSFSPPAQTVARFMLIALLLGTLPTGCKKTDDPGTQPSCRVTTRRNEAGVATNTWTYTADGQLNKLVYSSGSREEYTYNSDGYLTTLASINSTGTTAFSSSVEYANGRVTKVTSKNAAGTTTGTRTFEYDGTGSLSRLVEAYVGSFTYTYVFTNNKLTSYTERSPSGAESQPYTFENGLVKRYISGTSQTNYEYDAQGRRNRVENVLSGRVNAYQVYEYTDGTSYNEAINSFKGFPEAIRYGVILTGGRGLPSKTTGYTIPATGSTYKSFEYTYTYSKNTSGFPMETNTVYREYNATGSITYTSAGKNTYTYEGCQ